VTEVDVEVLMKLAQRDSDGQMFVGCTCPRFRSVRVVIGTEERGRDTHESDHLSPSSYCHVSILTLHMHTIC
jgi:hypothetical protein